jgi:hypothetical protein
MLASSFPPRGRGRRHQRTEERIRRAGAIARAQNGSAMAAALAEIAVALDAAAAVNDFKLRVEEALRRGPHDAAVRARFSARAALLYRRDLDAAIGLVECWWREERKAFQIASALARGTRASLEVLRELRLMLRLARFKQMQAAYHAAVAAVCDGPIALAAE